MKSWFSLRRPAPVTVEVKPSTADASLSDDELLRQFVIERDDRAFALLVGRHSGMVFGVCRRVLGLQHDAEDAFQAVFLILSRKANSLRCGGSLPAWLHKTAFRTALRARAARSRRREQSAEGFDMIAHDSCAQIASDHDGSIVDEELNALPERFRLPLYLCCIEGKSLEVAARQLGWSVGSVKGRLERGRGELRRRLLLRRVTPALGLAALATLTSSAQAAVPVAPSLIAATAQAGMQYAVGHSALGYVSQHALHLAQGSWKIMSLTTLKITVCSVTLTGLLILGGSRLPSPAAAEGTGQGRIVLEASLPNSSDYESQLALADREEAKTESRREGEKPAGARDGDKPRTGARDGERPAGTREGEGARRPAEGERPRTAGEGERGGNLLQGFKPQNEREELLVKMILQLQGEIATLRRNQQTREGGERPPVRREGEGAAPRREGDGARPTTGAREGDKPRTGAREGDAQKTGPREGDGAPKKE